MAIQENLTSLSRELQTRPSSQVVLESVLLLLIEVTSLSGNLLVLWVWYRRPSLRTVTNTYIGALALFDFLMASLVMPWTVGVLIKGDWVYGQTACRFQGFVVMLLAWTSLHTMALTAVNRYFRVVKPNIYRKYFTIKSSILMICAANATVVVVIVTPVAMGWSDFSFRPGKAVCFMLFHEQRFRPIYVGILSVLYTFGPMVLIYFCYYKVFRTVKNHVVAMRSSSNTLPGVRLSVAEVRVTRTVFAMVLGFTACWIPVTTVELMNSATQTGSLPRAGYLCYMYFAFMSNAINPIICMVINKTFRQQLLIALPCVRRSHTVDVSMAMSMVRTVGLK